MAEYLKQIRRKGDKYEKKCKKIFHECCPGCYIMHVHCLWK